MGSFPSRGVRESGALMMPPVKTLRPFLITGILGGFTTFSAFGLETLDLIRRGDPATAVLYVAASLVLGLLAVWGGWRMV